MRTSLKHGPLRWLIYLGFILADGAILDSRKSSRTCYLTISICDKNLLEQIKKTINSNHPIQTISPAKISIRGKPYVSSKKYKLRIGNKALFQDLINLGVRPRKSLAMTHPFIPSQYYNFFLRGYFDGDGCVYVSKKGKNANKEMKVIFTSGTKQFLENLAYKIHLYTNVALKRVYKNHYAFRLIYRKREDIKVLSFIYHGLNSAPYLERKYNKFMSVLAL